MEAFHDVLFPISISFGATGGPEHRTEIVQLASGHEKRNARLSQSRRRFDAGTGVRSADDLYEVLSFFEARRGSLTAFRFRDPFDMKSCAPADAVSPLDQVLGTGDGATRRFGLVKAYGTGADTYLRAIMLPVAGTLRVAVASVEAVSGAEFAFDAGTGEVVFDAGAIPGTGDVITAGYEFDVPVRFDSAELSLSLTAFRAGQVPNIPLMEVRL